MMAVLIIVVVITGLIAIVMTSGDIYEDYYNGDNENENGN